MDKQEEPTFSAPEGVHTLVDELKPPLLHSGVIHSPNLYPSRLTTITVNFPTKSTSQGLAALLWRRDKDESEEKEKGVEKGKDPEKDEKERKDDENSLSGSDEIDDPVAQLESDSTGHNSAEADANQQPAGLFSPNPAASQPGKKKPATRTTHNIRSTSSSFVTRIHTMEGLSKHLSSKQGDATFAFYNGAKSFFWSEINANIKEPLARVTFTAFPTCHDINRKTSSFEALDVIIGFNTGDLMWFDPINSRYVRINKQGSVTTSPCTCVRWVPGHTSMFLSAHADGTIIVYDKEREDGPFTAVLPPESPNGPLIPQDVAGAVQRTAESASSSSDGDEPHSPPIWNPLEDMLVSRPPAPLPVSAGSKAEKEKPAKNPVSHWRLCRRAITDFQFSPDMRHLAVVSEDGCLRIIDPSAEKLIDTYSSYFGSLSCVAWTPDSRLVLTGGQDDLVSIFSPRDQTIIARCQGHSSFVASVAVDPTRCDARGYRFGSVGEDKKIALWDFLAPPNRSKAHVMNRSISSPAFALAARPGAEKSAGPELPVSRYHPAHPRSMVPLIHPSMISLIQGDMLSNIAFVPSSILTVTRPGCMKSWSRPVTREVDMTAAQRELFARSPDVSKDMASVA